MKQFIEQIKKFIKDYYNYTTNISITETELFSKYEYLESLYDNSLGDVYLKEVIKDLLYDFIYNQNNIKEQIEVDLCAYGKDTSEYQYILKFYNKYRDLFNFKIEELESEVKL